MLLNNKYDFTLLIICFNIIDFVILWDFIYLKYYSNEMAGGPLASPAIHKSPWNKKNLEHQL